MNINSRKKELLLIFSGLLLLSFALLFFGTSSSPRYPINPWNDANAFFTVGKAMANGKIVYKDIFEQKGPLLYLLHCIAYKISHTAFTGVYILEAIALAVTGFFSYKTASIFLKKFASFIVAGITMTLEICSSAFFYGDSAEEFILPFLSVAVYYLVKYFKNSKQEELNIKHYLLNGFLAGCVAMIKYSLLGYWIAWMGLIAIHYLFVKKDIKKAFVYSFVFLGGMALAIIPWIIYFASKHSLTDFINVYFLINSSSYSSDVTIKTRIIDLIYNFITACESSPVVSLSGIAGILFVAISGKITDKKIFSRLAVPITALCGIFFIYIGGNNYAYYFLPAVIFSQFLLISILLLFNNKQKNTKSHKIIYPITAIIFSSALVCITFLTSSSSLFTPTDKKNCFQYKFADYIMTHNSSGTILYGNTIDCGVSLLCDYTTDFRYFELQNFQYEQYPENLDEINRYISEGKADFVIGRYNNINNINAIYKSNPQLKTKYNLVLSETNDILYSAKKETHKYTFVLFELKNKTRWF